MGVRGRGRGRGRGRVEHAPRAERGDEADRLAVGAQVVHLDRGAAREGRGMWGC